MDCLFSIVVPVYNTEKYITSCIESLLSQTYKHYEILLIDDGSTDTSGSICDKYAKMNPDKILCIHKKNEGLLMTRLRGYEESNGDYILNLDSDDEFRKDALEILNLTIAKTEADLILFQASIDEKYTKIWKNSQLSLAGRDVINSLTLKKMICEGPSINNMAFKCAKKELFSDLQNLKRYAGMNNEEDLIQSVQLIDKCNNPIYIPEMLYFYRQTNVSSISNNFNPEIFESIKNSGQSIEVYAKKWEKQCPGILELVYARHSKSCAALIRYFFERAESKEQIKDFLETLQRDSFFITAFKKGNKEKLSAIERINLFNVYHSRIEFVFAVMELRSRLKGVRYPYQMN